jgi:hypothetical protein
MERVEINELRRLVRRYRRELRICRDWARLAVEDRQRISSEDWFHVAERIDEVLRPKRKKKS